jgi:hypothetical protein
MGVELAGNHENPGNPKRGVYVKSSQWLKGIQRKAKWAVHRRFPNAFPFEKSTDYDLKRDREENEQTYLPDGEELLVPVLWGTEVFGPAEIDSFYANIKRLGWDRDARRSGNGAAKWIAELRLYGTAGNYNIGVVGRKKEGRFVSLEHFAPLPEEVDYLWVKVHQIASSVTCVTVAFVLKAAPSRLYQDELNRERKTERRSIPKSRAIAILGVKNLKGEAIKKTREQYRRIATDWFAEYMPGFFCQLQDGNRLPTAELITSTTARCLVGLSDNGRWPRSDWLNTLLPIGMSEVWTSASSPALKVVFDEFEDAARFHSVIALTNSEVPTDKLKQYGEGNTTAHAAYVNDQVNGVLALYSTLALLTEAARAVKLSREQLKADRAKDRIDTVLENIRAFFSVSVGLPAVGEDLFKHSANVSWYQDCAGFTTKGWGTAHDKTYGLPETLADRTNQLADRFTKDEAATRERFEQLASILSVRESVRAQKRMERLTVLALIVAFLSLLAAVPATKDWLKDSIEWAQNLRG